MDPKNDTLVQGTSNPAGSPSPASQPLTSEDQLSQDARLQGDTMREEGNEPQDEDAVATGIDADGEKPAPEAIGSATADNGPQAAGAGNDQPAALQDPSPQEDPSEAQTTASQDQPTDPDTAVDQTSLLNDHKDETSLLSRSQEQTELLQSFKEKTASLDADDATTLTPAKQSARSADNDLQPAVFDGDEEDPQTYIELALATLAEDDDRTALQPRVAAPAPGPETLGNAPEAMLSVQEPVTHKRRWGRIVATILVVLLVLTGIAYGIGVYYFSDRFFPNTSVNGEDTSLMTTEDLAQSISRLSNDYTIHVTGDGMDFEVTGPDMGVAYDGASYAQDAAAHVDPLRWPLELNEVHSYTVEQGITYDKDMLAEAVGAQVDKFNKKAEQPTDASLAYNEDAKRYVVTPDSVGTALVRDTVVEAVASAVANLDTEVSLDESCLLQPTVTADDEQLNSAVDGANRLLEANIALNIQGEEATNLEPAQVAGWISFNEDNYKLSVNRQKIQKWTQGALSERFDTVDSTRTYKRPDGKQVEVAGGTYGWILDGEALAATIADNLEEGVTDPIDVPMKETAANWAPGGKEWPNRYVDVDLSEQKARMYDDNSKVIWETECVTGKTSSGHATATGVFFIFDKESPRILVGADEDHDGEPDYRTPVTYWMPFYEGMGLHDADWRGSFGGDIYVNDGSHGCVNLPPAKAAELYNLVEVGTVVVVHN